MKKYGYIGILEAEYSSLYRQQENAFHGSEQEEELRPFCDELVFEKNFRKKVDMDIDRLIQKLKQGDTIVICNLIINNYRNTTARSL